MRIKLAKAFGWLGKVIAFPLVVLLVLLVAITLWLPCGIMKILPLPDRLRTRWTWALRRGFWNRFSIIKFRLVKPEKVPVPGRLSWWRWMLVLFFGKTLKDITRVPFNTILPGIPLTTIKVAGHEPADEWDGRMRFGTWLQVTLYRLFSPMQAGLPSIEADPYEAVRKAYTKGHRKVFDPPVMPLEFQGSPDLGALAVKGPYAGYLKRCGEDEYEWDFRELGRYQHYDGLYTLGVRVLFHVDRGTRTVKPARIESELGVSMPDDATWQFAKKLALCAATNHLSLATHFNHVHLAAGAHLAIATRNCLFPDHPLCRLLWPYIFRTSENTRAVALAQMAEGGDFDSIFSLTRNDMYRLFEESYASYDFSVNHPILDAENREIRNGGFDTPTQNDLERFFSVFVEHARAYIEVYYKSDADMAADPAVTNWIEDLKGSIPGPTGKRVADMIKRMANGAITRDLVAQLIACFMQLVMVRHDLLGSLLWNYQLWAHRQPPRLYRDGRRLPLDVYQRLVNANYNLNVRRTSLMLDEKKPPYVKDYSYLALPDGKGSDELLKDFQKELTRFEVVWRRDPWQVWRVYPSLLEVNINA
jgi:hypothetical protein